MAIFDQRPRRSPARFSRFRGNGALVAAAAVTSEEQAKQLQTLHQKWQSLAFGYYDRIGECWNPAQFYARSLAKLTVEMGEIDAETGETNPTENETVKQLFEPIQRAFSGEGGLGASYGRLKFLIGEGRQVQYRPPLSEDPESADNPPIWEFLSPTELQIRNDGREIVRMTQEGGGASTEYENISITGTNDGDPEPGQMRMWRFWRKHPRFSAQADSPVRAVLDLYEQLWWVTMGERSDIQSRIANAGILLIPREIDLEVSEAEVEALGEDPEADPFTVRIAGLMMEAIGDPGSAAGAVPGVIRAEADLLHPDKFRHLKFHDPSSSLFASQREEALIRRIGIGLDLPLEEIMGLSTANHWTAWKIDDEKWAHIQPVAQSWCDDVFAAIMRPLMIANGIQNPDDFAVIYDNTDLVTDPDKGKTAIVLHKDGVLGAEPTLVANGFEVEEQMSGQEREEWLAIQMRSLELLGIEPEPEPVPEAPQNDSDGIPDESEPDTEDSSEEEPAASEALRAIAILSLDRAREVAGAKVRGFRRSCPECFEGLEDVPNREIIAALGRDALKRMGAPAPGVLVAGVVSGFLSGCDRAGIKVTEALAMEIETYAAETLFTADPPPPSLDALA